jgi:hypothetical protein
MRAEVNAIPDNERPVMSPVGWEATCWIRLDDVVFNRRLLRCGADSGLCPDVDFEVSGVTAGLCA